jgi:uncharacterized protein YjbI with pentapeptide repeats
VLDGNAELNALVLEQMAADASIPSARMAILRAVGQQLSDAADEESVQRAALKLLLEPAPQTDGSSDPLPKLLRHRPVRLLLGAARIVADVGTLETCAYLGQALPRDLVQEAARGMVYLPALREILVVWLLERTEQQPMIASLLHATGWQWTPPPGPKARLGGAYLNKISWQGIALAGADLRGADLSSAALRRADFTGATLVQADLSGADLAEAVLANAAATRANFAGAILNKTTLRGADLSEANLQGARLEEANLRMAGLFCANLRGAVFAGADMSGASLLGVDLHNADFSHADLSGADLSGLRLSTAQFTGTRFYGTNLKGCDLEVMHLPGAQFRNANLERALLTGATMRGACFDGANLGCCGLADVDWEGASLQGADLRGASFHLGSTRSGLVGSPIAREGSMTGFYTDDYEEQDFKAPEEIRKANLCYADLRGAKIHGVDFYLVDLRHARFDPDREQHLRRSGAILEDRRRA